MKAGNPVCLVRYVLNSKEQIELLKLSEIETSWDVGFLNLLGDNLYFATGIFYDDNPRIFKLSIKSLSCQEIGSYDSISFFLAAYDRLFISCKGDTFICDLEGKTYKTLKDFNLCGAMGGNLYGFSKNSDICVEMDLGGRKKQVFESATNPIPAFGKLVNLDNTGGEPFEYRGTVTITDVETGEYNSFVVSEIPCSGYFNVSKEYIFLQRYWIDENGEIFLTDWNGEQLKRNDDRVFRDGVSLWGNDLLADVVPCDELFEYTVKEYEFLLESGNTP